MRLYLVNRTILRRVYEGGISAMDAISSARHDLLHGRHLFGSVQTTRGCPLTCSSCSVAAFHGGTNLGRGALFRRVEFAG
jgi:radical SAM superfamily enzyme YgiQ (UPF0313 family)